MEVVSQGEDIVGAGHPNEGLHSLGVPLGAAPQNRLRTF